MSSDAVANRQADIKLAMSIEYSTKKATAKHMIEVQKQVDIAVAQGEKQHEAAVAAYEAEQEAKALARQRKKDIALGRVASLGKSSGTSSSSRSSAYTTQSSSTASSSLGLKKPSRLFNDPNN